MHALDQWIESKFTFDTLITTNKKIIGLLQARVALNLDEWDKFTDEFQAIDLEVRRLRCKNDEVAPLPLKRTKIDSQSTHDGSKIDSQSTHNGVA